MPLSTIANVFDVTPQTSLALDLDLDTFYIAVMNHTLLPGGGSAPLRYTEVLHHCQSLLRQHTSRAQPTRTTSVLERDVPSLSQRDDLFCQDVVASMSSATRDRLVSGALLALCGAEASHPSGLSLIRAPHHVPRVEVRQRLVLDGNVRMGIEIGN